MKHLAEYRDQKKVQQLTNEISRLATRPWRLMEVCGGQTHSILRHGLDQLLPHAIELIHGPGCPVCVTPIETIDMALAIASATQAGSHSQAILCSFGDMLRVPGSREDLFRVKAKGGDVRVVYSPLDALKIAKENPDRQVVFLAIGFETTGPANAMAVKLAKRDGLRNFSMLVAHVLVPPAIEAMMQSKQATIDAFLAAGHVCAVTGYANYHRLCTSYRVPIVVTGFEPLDLLEGIRLAVRQLEAGEYRLENAYARVVQANGNALAMETIDEVFTLTDRTWRGLGLIPNSGWKLSRAFEDYDAALRFANLPIMASTSTGCRAGEVLQGKIKPFECEAFGTECTPRTPLGPTMVSSEGACAAHFLYRPPEPSHLPKGTGAVDRTIDDRPSLHD
jgi:hydrogenase expression/formation protein HypD